ncbi:MAG: SagB/ThcOx family dehydrogenase [Bacteroidaceae bacterium]|nr:SagB/ThcOx family dehydrogenase [Bacteroidaceae bacterium]
MKTIQLAFATLLTFSACCTDKPSAAVAAEQPRTELTADSIIKLTEPDKTLDVTLMQALSNRKSQREFSDRQLSLEELSTLLWAANGVNRDDGKRTAPSAVNAQDIDIYVCMASGAYLYDAKQSQLTRITTDDLRPAVCSFQQMDAPVFLVLVADLSRYPEGIASQRQEAESLATMDAGYVSANIGLYCAAAGLATVPRASMDKEALTQALSLTESQVLILNNPVGFSK